MDQSYIPIFPFLQNYKIHQHGSLFLLHGSLKKLTLPIKSTTWLLVSSYGHIWTEQKQSSFFGELTIFFWGTGYIIQYSSNRKPCPGNVSMGYFG